MRVKSYTEAARLARCAGEDAANRRMKAAGRKAWSDADYDLAVQTTQRILVDLGFDVIAWAATAGIQRNEPEPPPTRKTSRRCAAQPKPVQLSFAFG